MLANEALTTAGFVALIGLLITASAYAVRVTLRMSEISERVARLEERLNRDETNGMPGGR